MKNRPFGMKVNMLFKALMIAFIASIACANNCLVHAQDIDPNFSTEPQGNVDSEFSTDPDASNLTLEDVRDVLEVLLDIVEDKFENMDLYQCEAYSFAYDHWGEEAAAEILEDIEEAQEDRRESLEEVQEQLEDAIESINDAIEARDTV